MMPPDSPGKLPASGWRRLTRDGSMREPALTGGLLCFWTILPAAAGWVRSIR